MTDNANTPEQAGVQPELVAKVAEELMPSSDASGAQLLGEDGLHGQVVNRPVFVVVGVDLDRC